jgi:valyl-tRNA synthetase
MELAKSFEPADIERRWYPLWESRGYFAAGADTAKTDNFCILLPPPNVTGTLHMGHGFNQTLMDALTRYHRMRGANTLWQPGTDHAGIATQIVVERQLDAEGVSRHDLGREKFLERVWQWKDYSGGTITRQMRRWAPRPTGRASASPWTRASRRSSPRPSSASTRGADLPRQAAGELGPEAAHRGVRPGGRQRGGRRLHVGNPLPACRGRRRESLIVATTRPETMLGDVAVAVHPEDERYAHLVGKHVHLPLTGRTIPIIADELRRQGIRHRLRQDHAGARLQRLAGRPPPRLPPISILTSTRASTSTAPEPTAAWTATTPARPSSPTSRPQGLLVGRPSRTS